MIRGADHDSTPRTLASSQNRGGSTFVLAAIIPIALIVVAFERTRAIADQRTAPADGETDP
ncbi:hypothetical protein [Rhodococcoides yunnanense]|uniref:hypothetical protein n=1 Tax=Rhodococcoides yunnanense TaxID=278209 RepID=UPI0009352CAF|nr:hypothetical protein [Rhodococcus yunnanensis]